MLPLPQQFKRNWMSWISLQQPLEHRDPLARTVVLEMDLGEGHVRVFELRHPREESLEKADGRTRLIARDQDQLIRIAAIGACYVYTLGFFQAWLQTYLVKGRGFTEAALVLSSLTYVVGATANGTSSRLFAPSP